MRLLDENIKLKDIMLDPINPRFLESYPDSQEVLMHKLLDKLAAKELSNSMNQGIKWINKIVVRETESLPDENRLVIPEVTNYKYIVVEGNNRLACLKSGKVHPEGEEYTQVTKIPVLIACKELNEELSHYEMELKVVQGITNVMVVKEWDTVPKARHLYNLYEAKQKINLDKKMRQIIEEIAKELGMKTAKVREDVIRYAFFKEINQLSDTISKDDWGYLEAFDNSTDIRSLFGMSKTSLDFEWSKGEDDNALVTEKQELLIQIPEIINSAKKEFPNSKDFRDSFKKLYNRYKNIDDIRYTINQIINPDESLNWSSIEEENEKYTSEEKWRTELLLIYKKLDSFSIGADWAINLKNELINIKNKTEKYLKILES